MARKIVRKSPAPGVDGRRGIPGPSDGPQTPFHVRVLGQRDPVPISGTRDQKAAAIAGLQRGRAAREQLRHAAITKSQIQTMARNGALHLRLPGVYAVGHVMEGELTHETEV